MLDCLIKGWASAITYHSSNSQPLCVNKRGPGKEKANRDNSADLSYENSFCGDSSENTQIIVNKLNEMGRFTKEEMNVLEHYTKVSIHLI